MKKYQVNMSEKAFNNWCRLVDRVRPAVPLRLSYSTGCAKYDDAFLG